MSVILVLHMQSGGEPSRGDCRCAIDRRRYTSRFQGQGREVDNLKDVNCPERCLTGIDVDCCFRGSERDRADCCRSVGR